MLRCRYEQNISFEEVCVRCEVRLCTLNRAAGAVGELQPTIPETIVRSWKVARVVVGDYHCTSVRVGSDPMASAKSLIPVAESQRNSHLLAQIFKLVQLSRHLPPI